MKYVPHGIVEIKNQVATLREWEKSYWRSLKSREAILETDDTMTRGGSAQGDGMPSRQGVELGESLLSAAWF